jgi:hypothetical protein
MSNPDAEALSIEIRRYVSGVANNSSDVFSEMLNDTPRFRNGDGIIEVGDAVRQSFSNVLTRWAKAFHYKETRSIVPATGHIFVHWFTNLTANHVPANILQGRQHVLKRNGRDIGDQFIYITNTDAERIDIGCYVAAFRRSFLALMMVDYHGEIVDTVNDK